MAKISEVDYSRGAAQAAAAIEDGDERLEFLSAARAAWPDIEKLSEKNQERVRAALAELV